MPDVRMPDGTIIHNVPEGTTRAELQARLGKKQKMDALTPDYGAAALITNKMTGGISDKAVPLAQAGIRYLGAKMAGKAPSGIAGLVSGERNGFGDIYQRAQAAQDRRREDYKASNPGIDWLTLPTNLMMGAPKKAVGLLANGWKGLAKSGAGFGLLAGIGGARGDAKDQTAQIALSTGTGAALAPVVGKIIAPAIGSRVSRAIRRAEPMLAKRPYPLRRATSIVGKALADQGTTPRQAGKMIEGARTRGVPLALMDTGDETRGLTSALARRPGPNRTLVRDAVIPRQEAQLERVQSAITRDLGPVANIRQQSESLIDEAKVAAGPLYEKAYAAAPFSTPQLNELLNTPFGRQALSRARTIAANERRDPAALGFALDGNGNVVLNPVASEEIGRLDAARQGWDAANAAYEAALRKQQASLAPNQLSAEVDLTTKALAAANAELDAAKKAFAQAPKSGTVQEQMGYTPRTLDYVKRGMDDIIEAQRDPITGKLRLDEAGRAQNDVLRSFLSEVDRANPDYAAARRAYSGPASAASALNRGSKIINKSAEDIEAEVARLNLDQLDQYRLGARSALSNMLEGRVDTADKVKALVGTPKKREALQYLFGDSGDVGNLANTLADEKAAAETFSRVATGSATSANDADLANLSGLTGVVANAGGRLASGQGLFANAIGTGRDLLRYGLGEQGKRVQSELAALLTETRPEVLAGILQAARRDAAIKRLSEAAARRGGMAGSNIGGGLLGRQIPALADPYQPEQ